MRLGDASVLTGMKKLTALSNPDAPRKQQTDTQTLQTEGKEGYGTIDKRTSSDTELRNTSSLSGWQYPEQSVLKQEFPAIGCPVESWVQQEI